MPRLTRRLYWILMTLLLFLAAALRLVDLPHLPPGLSHDEAYNGITAIEVLLQGRRDIFFDIYNGIEPLIVYWQALYFHLFGIGPFPMRLVNVTAGLLTVALTAAFAHRAWDHRQPVSGRWLALLAAVGVGLSFWAIFISRLALRAVTLPLIELLAIYCLWRGLSAAANSRRTQLWFVAAGVSLGAAMYTYLSARFLPLVPLLLFGWWLARGQAKRRHWLGMGLLVLTWAAVFAPLALYFWQHPQLFGQRAAQVLTLPAALAGDFGPLLTSVGHTLGAFGLLGPESSRYGLAGKPILEPLAAVFFWLGLGTAVCRLRRPAQEAAPYALLLIWWLVLLAPDFITSESPHYLRMVGALPPTTIFWALGVVTSGGWLLHRRPALRTATMAALSIYIIVAAGLTTYDYFGRWAHDEEARAIYGAEFTELTDYLQTHTLAGLPAISSAYYRDWDRFRLDLHMAHHPPFAIWFHGPETLLLPPPGSGLDPSYFFLASAPPHARWADYLQLQMAGRDMSVYRLLPGAAVRLSQPTDAVFGARLDDSDLLYPVAQVQAYELAGAARAGHSLPLLVHWTPLRDLPASPDFAFYVHLRDAQGSTWAQVDSSGYDAADWQPGVQALQWLELPLPPDLPPITYTLQLGLQDRAAGRPLPLLQPETGEASIVLQTIIPAIADPPPTTAEYAAPNPLPQTPGSLLALHGYSVNPTWAPAGESIDISLFWQAQKQPAEDYTLLLWLQTEDGVEIPLLARQPLAGQYPTGRWQAGQWVRDRFRLTPPPEAVGQLGDLYVGWQDAAGNWLPDDEIHSIRLTQVFFAE